jgi:hypothetical protein
MKYGLLWGAHFEKRSQKTGDGRLESLTAVWMRIETFWDLIFVFPCIIIYGFIRTSLMQIV